MTTLPDLVPDDDRPACAGVAGDRRQALTFRDLRAFLSVQPVLRDVGVRPGVRCAVALPEGPELAVCLLAVASRATAVPLNPWSPAGELSADIAATDARFVVVAPGGEFDHVRDAARQCGATVLELHRDADTAGLFRLTAATTPERRVAGGCEGLNGPADTALELFTSGTSGAKKRVPISLADLCVGSACIAAALELGPADRGYNMMPLFHVGGIVRNVLAPLLAGSPMVYSEGFDPSTFWDELTVGGGFTWYYASPTMHDAVLAEAHRRPPSDARLRFICNATGALLPATAAALERCFGASVLPGYGMTECMPIACMPLDAGPERLTSSGRVLGPEVAVVDDAGRALPAGAVGQIVLRGAPLSQRSGPDGWFCTGDIGRVEGDGYLTIVGRDKDVIKRGGETLAPAEIENVLVGHPDVAAACAFGVPHERLGEAVGCAIVPAGESRVGLSDLTGHLATELSTSKWPVLIVYMDALPTSAAGKLLRVGLAERLGIAGVDESQPAGLRLYEAQCPPKGTPIGVPIPARRVESAAGPLDRSVDAAASTDVPADDVEAHVLAEWRRLLGSDRPVGLDSDFFDDLGGGSLVAVQLIADLRRHFAIPLAPTAIFKARSVRALSAAVRQALADGTHDEAQGTDATVDPPGPAPRSQTAPAALVTQAVPLVVLPVVLRVGQFGLWMAVWWSLRQVLGGGGIWLMFAALAGAGAVKAVVAPLAVVALKWTVVGRHREGLQPLWGHRYLRWWLVQQVVAAVGMGAFATTHGLTALYLRMLGARVGRGTKISPTADLGEHDLLDIGDGACIDESAVVRPFRFERSAMALRPIRIGAGVSVGTRATVVPGTVLPDGSEVSPLGTSDDPGARDQGTRGLSRTACYDPPAALRALGTLLRFALVLGSWVPVVLVVHRLVHGIAPTGHLSGPADLARHMIEPQRLLRSLGVLAASTVATPFAYLAGVIAVKWAVVGRFSADDDLTRAWPRFERWLIWQLLPDGRFGGVAPLLGSNFRAISGIYRLLGAKVGSRIYWPGSGNVITEYDLFECGDDVTFGSRSTYLMTSGAGSRPVRIEAGANVADRCVLAPGVVVGRNAVLGSGTFAPEGFTAPPGSTWIGHDGTTPIELEAPAPRRADAPTLRPYGRAMYHHEAPYRVWPLGAHIAFNVLWAVLRALFGAAPLFGALLVTHDLLGHGPASLAELLAVAACALAAANLLAAALAATVVVATKWAIIGRRVAGDHFWDLTAYCQRWKIHSVISSLVGGWVAGRDLPSLLGGSAYLVWWFRALGARIGSDVCLYPNGADPMMEEPDLLTIGDGACIDQAVLIAHLNTRGEWVMGPIAIGAGAHLRTASRVMMMSTVGDGATLCEGSLVLAGDCAGTRATWRGWPGQAVDGGLRARPDPARAGA